MLKVLAFTGFPFLSLSTSWCLPWYGAASRSLTWIASHSGRLLLPSMAIWRPPFASTAQRSIGVLCNWLSVVERASFEGAWRTWASSLWVCAHRFIGSSNLCSPVRLGSRATRAQLDRDLEGAHYKILFYSSIDWVIGLYNYTCQGRI